MSVPKNWPPHLKYISSQQYSKALPVSTLAELKKPSGLPEAIPLSQAMPRGPSSLVKITLITTTSHPANGQSGLFAARDLKPGSYILRYLGQVHITSDKNDDNDPHAHSDYDLSLDRDLRVGIDADNMGNEARFINDYRGIGDRPNAEFKEIWDEKGQERGIAVFVLPERKYGKGKGGIKKGEEILVSYGKGFWGARKSST